MATREQMCSQSEGMRWVGVGVGVVGVTSTLVVLTITVQLAIQDNCDTSCVFSTKSNYEPRLCVSEFECYRHNKYLLLQSC